MALLGAVVEFKREMMLERQRKGIVKAMASGKKFGRPSTVQVKADEISTMRQQGLAASEIAKRVGVSRTSVHRVVNELAQMRGSIAS